MHDRAVRRRRAVLVVLVAASLILLTAYYGESSDGRLHSVQRGALGALSPIQEGASRVLKPFRDLFGWFGDTIDAKDQRDEAVAERDALPHAARRRPEPAARGRAAGGLNERDTTGGMSKYGPVDARVTCTRPNTWYQRMHDQQGHRRRRQPRRPGDQRRRAGRQGRGGDRRRRGRHADHRPRVRAPAASPATRASPAASRPPSARPATCCSSRRRRRQGARGRARLHRRDDRRAGSSRATRGRSRSAW